MNLYLILRLSMDPFSILLMDEIANTSIAYIYVDEASFFS